MHVYNPAVGATAADVFPGVYVANSPVEAAIGADTVLVLTDWSEFRQVDLSIVKQAMVRPLIINGRHTFSTTEVHRNGLDYRALGRGNQSRNRK